MLGNELLKRIRNGQSPVIEFTERVEMTDIDPDEGMRCRVIGCSDPDSDGVITAQCDFKGFEDFNKIFAKPNYYDKQRIACLTWFNSGFYPENGIYNLFLDINFDEVCFEVVEENILYQRYLESKSSKTYVQWLENTIAELESKLKGENSIMLEKHATPPGELIKLFPDQIATLILDIASRSLDNQYESLEQLEKLTVADLLKYYEAQPLCLFGFKVRESQKAKKGLQCENEN